MFLEGIYGNVVLGLLVLGGLAAYLGLGAFATTLLGAFVEYVQKKEEKPVTGLSRFLAWASTIGWPLSAIVAIAVVALALFAFGVVVGFILALLAVIIGVLLLVIALIIAVILIVIGLIIAIILAIIAFILGAIVGIAAIVAACSIVAVFAIIVLSPFLGVASARDAVMKFHPVAVLLEKRKEGDAPVDGEGTGSDESGKGIHAS